ncbi:condensation domain-containing protein [Nocardia colli]|uniref:condensation domain-containing protein n=1 Tax=Nocardia colli TaxID=2545717 RepID=UPI0035D7E689
MKSHFQAIRSDAETTSVTAPVPPAQRAAPASATQRGLWVADSFSGSRNGSTVTHAYEMRGPLDERNLVAALQATQDRHDALRTRFEMRGEQLWQTVADRTPVDYVRTDLRGSTIRQTLAEVAADQFPEPLDLSVGPVFRAQLLVLTDAQFLLLLHVHQAVNDARSMAVLEREISDRYAQLPVEEPQTRQFWQLNGQLGDVDDVARKAATKFWGTELADMAVIDELDGENADQTYHGAWVSVECTEQYLGAAEAGAKLAASPFALLMAAMHLAMSMLHESTDNVVGTAISVRPPDFEDAVGPFVNTVPIRLRIDPMWTGKDAVAATASALGRVLEHHGVPFEDALPAALASRPVIPVTLTSNTALGSGLALPGLSCRRIEFDSHWCQRDLAVYLNRDDDTYILRACRSVARYSDRATVDLLQRTKRFLGALAARPDALITELGWQDPGAAAEDVAVTAPAVDEPTATLALVRATYADILRVPEADLVDDFFDAGGTSLAAMRLSARLPLSIREIFRLRSMRALARAIDDMEDGHAGRT